MHLTLYIRPALLEQSPLRYQPLNHAIISSYIYALELIVQHGDFSDSMLHNVIVYKIIIFESTTWPVSFYTNRIVLNSPQY